MLNYQIASENLDNGRTAKYSTEAHGDPKSLSKNQESERGRESAKTENQKTKSAESAVKDQRCEKEKIKEGADIIRATEQRKTKRETKIGAKTRIEKMQGEENGTSETETTSGERSDQGELKETQPTDSQILYRVLKEEKSSSIKLLDDSAEQLMSLVETSLKPKRVAEDNGEVLQGASDRDVDNTLKCLNGVNQILKTKLDYLRFAKEIREDK